MKVSVFVWKELLSLSFESIFYLILLLDLVICIQSSVLSSCFQVAVDMLSESGGLRVKSEDMRSERKR
jgi:nitrate/nitrite-specific signal transduction histidine kinase